MDHQEVYCTLSMMSLSPTRARRGCIPGTKGQCHRLWIRPRYKESYLVNAYILLTPALGGSVTMPAALNGVYGLKPSCGRLPIKGVANGVRSSASWCHIFHQDILTLFALHSLPAKPSFQPWWAWWDLQSTLSKSSWRLCFRQSHESMTQKLSLTMARCAKCWKPWRKRTLLWVIRKR